MSWGALIWLGLIPVVLLIAGAMAWGAHRHHAALGRLFSGALLARVLPRSVRARRLSRDVLAVAGVALLVLALAEPRFGKKLSEVKAEGVDLILAIDLSRSMDARDVDPSRLLRAQREVFDLLTILEGDRVGMVVYAGGAWPRMPLTRDLRAVELVTRELDTSVFAAQGSALGEAIRSGIKLLSSHPSDAGQAIIVLTDGEIHRPDEALAAADEAARAGISIYGVVVGSEPAPIPNDDGTVLRDSTGAPVMSTPSSKVLEDVARKTGGAVVQSVPSIADMTGLYQGEIRAKLRTAAGRSVKRERWNTAFQWPLGMGLALLLLSAWLGDGRRTALVMTVLLALLPAAARAETVREGDALYRQGRYSEAVEVFTDLSLERPDDPDVMERLAAARYRAGDFEGAARAWERKRGLRDDLNAAYNAANAWYRSGHLERALERYEEVLASEPEHGPTVQNRDMLMQELELRRLQQQQQQQQQQGDGGESEEESEGEQEQDDPQSQDGQQGQPGQDGQPQESDGQDQAGDAQQGEPQDPPDPSQDPSGKNQPSEDGEEAPEGDGTREEEEAPTDEVSMDDLQPEGDEGGDAGGEAAPGEPAEATDGMTAEQAGRVLDGVEEGKYRVYVPGDRGEHPW